MSSLNSISSEKLWRLIGVPHGPAIVDVRPKEGFAANPRFVPGAVRRAHSTVADWSSEFTGRSAVVICEDGQGLSEGVAAWLRHAGASSAEVLLGGHASLGESGPAASAGRQVAASQFAGANRMGDALAAENRSHRLSLAHPPLRRSRRGFPLRLAGGSACGCQRFNGAPFDIEGVFWSHRGDRCTFDTLLDELGLQIEPLAKLAAMVRGADTARLDLAPEAPGLAAASLGLSRMYSDDLEQLAATMTLYDALYRWARDASDETHDWPTNKPKIAERPLERRTPVNPHPAKAK